jgi:N-acetylglucosamine kinase-like BadF-type ATPase
MTGYVVAADGGNSKTDLVVADLAGTVLAHRQVPGTTPQRDGMATTMQELVAGVRTAIAAAGRPADTVPAVGVFCLANVDLAEDEVCAREHLTGLGVANRIIVRNDTYAVLRAGAPDGIGVAVVCGAGINAVGVAPDGRIHRFLGLGPESGDWGGAEAVGLAGLGAAVRAGDGRGPDTVLRRTIPDALSRPDPEAVAVDVNRELLGARELRRLAPVVFDAATAGDQPAVEIVTRLAEEIVSFAVAALRELELLSVSVPVVLGGGILQSRHALLLDRVHSLLREAAPNAVPAMLDVAPVAGALDEALQAAGASAEARARARASLPR